MMLHYSGIKLFNWCPAGFDFCELQDLPHRHPLELADAMNRGSSFHGVASDYGVYCQKLERETDLEAINDLARSRRHEVADDQLSTFDFHIEQFKKSAWVMIGQDDLFERKLFHPIPGTDTTYYGTVDRVIFGLCTQILDYKTQMFVPPKSENPPRQLLGYAWLTWKEMPQVIEWPMQLTLAYVQNCTEQTWQVSESDLEEFEQYLTAIALKIEQSKYKPTPHPDVCANCPYVAICPAFKKVLPTKNLKNIRTITDFYRRAKTFCKAVEPIIREQTKNKTINGVGYYNCSKEPINKDVIFNSLKYNKAIDKDELAVTLMTKTKAQIISWAKKNEIELPEGAFSESVSTHFGVIPKKI